MSDNVGYVQKHSKPANAAEFNENAEVAAEELTTIIATATHDQLAGLQELFAFHKKWTPFCGHKRLGRLYNASQE